jgi:hypothetical protein
MQASPYSERNAIEWDEIIVRCPMATFLHTRRFLAYHHDRFRDVSLLLKNEKRTVGLFPAAVDPADARRVVSHPGITYGGVLHRGELYGEGMIDALVVLSSYYADQGFETLRYKTVPHIYHQAPSEDDVYALFRVGAQRLRCDLSCAIDLLNPREPGSRRKRGLKKALRQGVRIAEGAQFVDELWKVVTENYQQKLGAKPVHTKDEIRHLYELFPQNIKFVVALLNQEIIAGVVFFSTPSVTHTQYIASSERGYDVCALDAILDYAIEQASAKGLRFFDFGTSNKDEGRHLSTNVYNFKIQFGAGGVAHEFYDIDLKAWDSSNK